MRQLATDERQCRSYLTLASETLEMMLYLTKHVQGPFLRPVSVIYESTAVWTKEETISFFTYRIFSIKRRGCLFKTRPRRPGVYLNPAFIRGPAFNRENRC